jgi:tetratricopeptide (TPR) repeat protein
LAALDLLEKAIARDGEFGLALALASHIHSRNFLFAWTGDREHSRRTATELAHRALQSSDNDPRVIGWAAWAMSNVGADPRTVESMTKRALEINPNSADLWIYAANVNMWAGRAEQAMNQFETAARLDPRSPDRPLILGGIGTCFMLQRRFEEALSAYSEATELRPQYAPGQAGLAVCCAHLGRMADAKKALAAVDPMVIPTLLNLFQDPETREFLRSTLKKAGAAV